MNGNQPIDDDASSQGQWLLDRLVKQGIVPEKSAKSLVELNADPTWPVGPDDPHKLLEQLVVLGLLNSFQKRKIIEEGVDALRLGPYVLLDQAGKGGMGEVLRARHVELEREVALKILPRQLTSSEERRERFRREIRLLAKLDHPGIVKALDAGQWGEVPYLAMEYISGGTLQDMLHDAGPLAWNRLVRCMIPVCDALAHAHDLGIVHRDIKPSNLAIDGADHLKILDLGLARATLVENDATTEAFATAADQALGTADFMAPEQAEGAEHIGPAADIYSLGCTFFTLMTGRPIFGGSNIVEKVMRHRTKRPPSIVELRPEVPREFEELIIQMVAKSPAARPANMREVQTRLTEIAEQYQLSDSSISDRSSLDAPRPRPRTPKKSSERTVVMTATKRRGISWQALIANRQMSRRLLIPLVGLALCALPIVALTYGWLSPTATTSSVSLTSQLDNDTTTQEETIAVAPANPLADLLQGILAAGGQVELLMEAGTAAQPLTAERLSQLSSKSRFRIRLEAVAPTTEQIVSLGQQPGFESAHFLAATPDSISLRDLAQADSLRELELKAPAFNSADLVWLKQCAPLRDLTIHRASTDVLLRVAQLDQLEQLDLSDLACKPAELRNLTRMKGLKVLRLAIGRLDHKSVHPLFDALPACHIQFSSNSPVALAKWLIRLPTVVAEQRHQTKLRQLIVDHQQELLSKPSNDSYLALHEYANWVDENVTKDARRELMEATLRMNKQLLETASKKQRVSLLESAGELWNKLGGLYLRERDSRTVQYYQNSIEAYEKQADSRKYAPLIAARAASLALYFSFVNRPVECRSWADRGVAELNSLGKLSASIARGENFWAWSRIGEALAEQAPEQAVEYLERAHEIALHVPPKRLGRRHALAASEAARVNLLLGRGARAAQLMRDNLDLLHSYRSQDDYPQVIRESLCSESAIAILTDDIPGFVKATDALVSLRGKTNVNEVNDLVWDFISLRGWQSPLTEDNIQLQSQGIGDWPPIARTLAVGTIQPELVKGLSFPADDGSRDVWHQALSLRLSAVDNPTDAQHQQAAELVSLQAATRDKQWQERAIIAGLLGPLTGPPLADISPLQAPSE